MIRSKLELIDSKLVLLQLTSKQKEITVAMNRALGGGTENYINKEDALEHNND